MQSRPKKACGGGEARESSGRRPVVSVLNSPFKDVWPILVPVDELFRHVITLLPEAMLDHVLLDHLRRIVFLCDEKAYFVVGADRSVQRCSVQ